MSSSVDCSCGKRLELPDGFDGTTVRCPTCETVVAVEVSADNTPVPTLAAAATDHAPATAVLANGCPNCRAALPLGAVLCVACGMNLRTGQRLTTQVASQSDTVDIPVSSQLRLVMTAIAMPFVLMAAVVLMLMLVSVIGPKNPAAGPVAIAAVMLPPILTGLLLFKLPAGLRYAAMRSGDGTALLTRTRLLGPIKFDRTFPIQRGDAVWFVQSATRSEHSQTIVLAIMLLLLCAGLVPGLIFWFALKKSADNEILTYRAELRGASGTRVVYSGGEQSKHDAQDIAHLVRDTAGIALQQELGMF